MFVRNAYLISPDVYMQYHVIEDFDVINVIHQIKPQS
ncbi:hypothetical protein B6N60_00616 [Richelia sinica FACHB-800]|uniref:Uncharacterized protein n=1 Tax=Richelia sinica FACHB-800 TaxID=1357546 RepID=A0A975T5R0_9NOST|nr:hypothetical protein B6N60_00616 [Richelia sinica FACHB-800]